MAGRLGMGKSAKTISTILEKLRCLSPILPPDFRVAWRKSLPALPSKEMIDDVTEKGPKSCLARKAMLFPSTDSRLLLRRYLDKLTLEYTTACPPRRSTAPSADLLSTYLRIPPPHNPAGSRESLCCVRKMDIISSIEIRES